MKTIEITSTNGFLNLEDLPQNCIFNKVVTGCGGTTIALNNTKNYVIAVPTKELIINKIKRNDGGVGLNNVFGLFGTFTYQLKKELKEYVSKEGTKKIICTYDKLPKLEEYINTEDYQLLIDEYHSLLKAFSYRESAITGVLDNFKKYKSFCFMSATPISPEFTPAALEGIEYKEANWVNGTDNLVVKLQYSNKPYVTASNIIAQYKKDGFIEVGGNKSYEAFFFINSVKDIVSIINHTELKPEDVRIICADEENNRKKLPEGFKIENSNCPNKMFTFLTCKSFEGVDYESETALCFVISSSSNPHTQASIDTDIPQIAGRIRTKTNPFRNTLIHIFNRTYKDLGIETDYETLKSNVEKELEAAEKLVDMFNSLEDENMKKVLSKTFNNKYIAFNKDKFVFYDTLPKLELYNYKLNQIIYKDGISISKAYANNGILTTEVGYSKEIEELNKAVSTKKASFKELYLEALNKYSLNECKDELVRKAIKELTPEEVKSVKYTRKGVTELLVTKNDRMNLDSKIAKLFKQSINYNEFIKNERIVSLLANIYSELGINKEPKALDIKKWFDVESGRKKEKGIDYRGYYVLRSKIVFNYV